MGNPLFGKIGGGNQTPMNNNMFNLVQQFYNFKRNFKGDPKQQVQDLLNSGKMTQDQLEQCESMAKTFQSFLGKN